MELTDTEKRLEELLSRYAPPPTQAMEFHHRPQQLVSEFERILPPELVAYTLAQHASALVAAQKAIGVMREELADSIAEDFRDTVIRGGNIAAILSRVGRDG